MPNPLTTIKRINLPTHKRDVPDHLSTGSVELDAMLNGGWIQNGINEITGDPDTGKSLITLATIGATIKRGEMAVLIDADGMFDQEWARTFFPVASPNFGLLQNIGAEDTFNLIAKLAYNRSAPLIVLDSWSALPFALDRALDLVAQDGQPNQIHRMRGWAFASFLRGLNLVTGTFLFTSHKPVQIGHVEQLPAYVKSCDVRVETVAAPRDQIRARVLGGKLARRSSVERVW